MAVVLNLMKAFDLAPDTLEEMHKGVREIKHQHLFGVILDFPKQPDVEINFPPCIYAHQANRRICLQSPQMIQKNDLSINFASPNPKF